MLERFYPNEYLDSVYDIDFEMYYKQGIRGIISDIDNTLVPHGAPATEEIVALFDKIHVLYQIIKSKELSHLHMQ